MDTVYEEIQQFEHDAILEHEGHTLHIVRGLTTEVCCINCQVVVIEFGVLEI